MPKIVSGIYSQRIGMQGKNTEHQTPGPRNHRKAYREFGAYYRKFLFLSNVKHGGQVLDNPSSNDLSIFWNIV